jgi:hypothetical protein
LPCINRRRDNGFPGRLYIRLPSFRIGVGQKLRFGWQLDKVALDSVSGKQLLDRLLARLLILITRKLQEASE